MRKEYKQKLTEKLSDITENIQDQKAEDVCVQVTQRVNARDCRANGRHKGDESKEMER